MSKGPISLELPTETSAGVKSAEIAVVGVSVSRTCGVQAHAALLAQALSRENVAHSLHWLWRGGESMRADRLEVQAWARRLVGELSRSPADAVLLHYSVFAYSHRGLPLFVRPTLSALHSSRIPLITVMHELAYPWAHGGLSGRVWASTQRAVLIAVMRASRAVVVTADFRAEWLASRPWLPRRPVMVAPVFSNLPAPAGELPPGRSCPVVGLFGYSYEGASISLVLDAVRLLKDQGVEVRLILLGAPGRSSTAGKAWLAGAQAREVTSALSFSGALPAQDLADALAACDALLFADTSGPSSRKGTLAASLGSGRPVIAIDGPRRWSKLVESEAARVVAPTAHALADALRAVLDDEDSGKALGARGRAFAEQEMGVGRTASVVRTLLSDIVAGAAS
jgi:glycosyltransferase involved in cell wall biosynthesis